MIAIIGRNPYDKESGSVATFGIIKAGNATYMENLRKKPAISLDKNPVFLRRYPNPKRRNKGRNGTMKLNMKKGALEGLNKLPKERIFSNHIILFSKFFLSYFL